jgi:hypothetical protein
VNPLRREPLLEDKGTLALRPDLIDFEWAPYRDWEHRYHSHC